MACFAAFQQDPESPNMNGNFIIIPGMYAIFIADWLQVFPRQQFLFIKFENYVTNKVRELNKVTNFLNTGEKIGSIMR